MTKIVELTSFLNINFIFQVMKIFIVVVFLCLCACAGRPPFLEYSIAFSAIEAAKKTNSDKNATAEWVKAIRYYRQAEEKFQARDYNTSTFLFNESINWAEKAESTSRLKMSMGEGI